MKIFDDSMRVARAHSRTTTHDNGAWIDGEVLTPHGIVSVYAQGNNDHIAHSRLDFVWRGRLHMRNFSGKKYTSRGLVLVAARFAKEIATK